MLPAPERSGYEAMGEGMMDWMPIETAPRDQRILGYTPKIEYASIYGHVRIIEASEYKGRPVEWTHFAGDDTTEVEPTHWMPLPDPPVCNASEPGVAKKPESVATTPEKV
jgi:hypothetical protein